jgi:uncharacterized protein (DUF169 family)/NAD-dependent dihydropyrimidine dehydrogenase PreA subunit
MSFIIDQTQCAACGSCFGNCPNRAIIKKGEGYFVTDMCSDCGACLNYCAMAAIGKGSVKTEFDNKNLNSALQKKLGLKKQIAAMKYADKAPNGVPVEKGPHFWCGICGDIFDGEESSVFFTSRASSCGGCANIGIGPIKATREQFDAAIHSQVVGEGNLYATKDVMPKNRALFPLYPKVYGGVILGSLQQVSRPDVILFPVNGHQMTMISTAFAFDTGEVIMGYAGKSMCLMTISTPLGGNRPVFSTGDHGGRTFMRLKEEEFIISFPYRLIPGLVKNLDRTVYAKE